MVAQPYTIWTLSSTSLLLPETKLLSSLKPSLEQRTPHQLLATACNSELQVGLTFGGKSDSSNLERVSVGSLHCVGSIIGTNGVNREFPLPHYLIRAKSLFSLDHRRRLLAQRVHQWVFFERLWLAPNSIYPRIWCCNRRVGFATMAWNCIYQLPLRFGWQGVRLMTVGAMFVRTAGEIYFHSQPMDTYLQTI
jgi:hypothetical protein